MRALAKPSVTFEPTGHTYALEGRPVVSVTKVLQIIQTLEGIPWQVLEDARIFGQNVHMAVDLENKRILDYEGLNPILREYVDGYRLFLRQSKFVPFASEMIVASPMYSYAGMLDLFGALGKDAALVDVKSTASLPFTVGPQTAGYERALLETTGQKVTKRFCLHLGPNRYKLVRMSDPQDFNYFLSCLNVVKLMKRVGKIPQSVTPF